MHCVPAHGGSTQGLPSSDDARLPFGMEGWSMRQLPDHGCSRSSVSSQKFPEKYGVDEQIFDVPAKLGGMREADG